MPFGPVKIFDATVASGADTGSADLSKAWSRVYAEVASLSTNAEIAIQGSADGSTYRALKFELQSGTVAPAAQLIGSAAVPGIIPIDVHVRYIKFKASAVVSGGVVIKLHCSD